MKRRLLMVVSLLWALSLRAAPAGKIFVLRSPDSRIEVRIDTAERLAYTVSLDASVLLSHSEAALRLADGTEVGVNERIARVWRSDSVTEHIEAPFYRQSEFDFKYNGIKILFRSGFGVEFRAADEGVAYRFFTQRKGETVIADEKAEFRFAADGKCYIPYSTNEKQPLAMAFQNTYDVQPLSDGCRLPAFLPATVETPCGAKVTLAESDLESYPGMFLTGEKGSTTLCGLFARYPASTDFYPWRQQEYVVEREDFIARSTGARTYPWRIIAVATDDRQMPVNNMVYALASPSRIGDTSWIRPGFSAWEWWNDWGLTGVDFAAGINMPTYKYYIDFAARNGLEYVILDEGWYTPQSGDMLTPVETLDLPELVHYADERGVKLILWTVFNVLDKDLEEACRRYSDMGIAGFKVDFLDRDDQTAVEMIYRIAECAARHRLLLDYHGIFKPTGINRTYPNVINYEAVFGQEEVKWSEVGRNMPLYNVTFPFIRLMAGYVDYTPGAMRNAAQRDFHPVYSNPASMGTRAHQVAAYIVFDSPLTMLCDSPTAYESEPATTAFITSLPRRCDETIILQGTLGEYIVTARRDGEDWSIGALTSWTPRTITLDFSFLPQGSSYRATLFADGVNAARNAEDCRIETFDADSSTRREINLAPGGGFALRLKKL